jgi:hypothetical protein
MTQTENLSEQHDHFTINDLSWQVTSLKSDAARRISSTDLRIAIDRLVHEIRAEINVEQSRCGV